MSSMRPVVIFFALSGVSLPLIAHEEDILFNRVFLEAQAQRRVPNDEMQVLLVTEHQGKSPQGIAESVNADMNWALSEAKAYKEVAAATRGYQTFPIYDKRIIVGWRATQELQLTSQSMTRLTELAGKLQERLQVHQMLFRPTKKTQDQYQDELIEEALVAFKRRAEIVGRQMENKEYRIVELHVNAGGDQPPVMFAERAAMMAADANLAPSVEAGTSTVTVTVSGSIQFY
ncbi:MAG: SIMPL domain-containing protein [Gammaproteobacteria bacterium]